jgi:hypothetical protein
MEEINWTELRDNHCLGLSKLGRIWIRVDRAGQVTGIYTMFGRTNKWVPSPLESLTLDDGKIQAEFLLAADLAARKLFEK